jgi:hypothetical protein
MKASEFLTFLRTRPLLLVILIVTALAMGVARVWKSPRHQPDTEVIAQFTSGISNVHFSTSRPIPPPLVVCRTFITPPHSSALSPAQTNRPVDLLSLHGPPAGPYAPSHRLLRCVLVNAVDSAIPDAPIIGLVTEDLWHAGELVVPKGTEIHGRAQADRVRDRILSQPAWTLVWQSGEELTVSGKALNREVNPDGTGWSLTDGSVGLAGAITRSQSLEEIKLFLATALSGFAMGLQQQNTTVMGIEHTPANARNAAITGTSQVLNQYSQEVLQAIKKDGIYVMVPPGKSFYVLVEGPIDRAQVHVADASSDKNKPAASAR